MTLCGPGLVNRAHRLGQAGGGEHRQVLCPSSEYVEQQAQSNKNNHKEAVPHKPLQAD
jgi:hypothetical protein